MTARGLRGASEISGGTANSNGNAHRRRQRMPYRNLQDDNGCNWEIWDVIPIQKFDARPRPDAADGDALTFLMPADLRGGWLAFQSSSEWRCLAPIPANWIDLSDAELLLLIAQAVLVLRISN